MEVRSSDNETDVSVLRASHGKADTSLILHCHHIRCRTAAVLATYADMLLLLHIHLVSLAPSCWWYEGPRKRESILISRQSTALLLFHTLTGCGTTSFFLPQPFEDVGIEGLLSKIWAIVFRREGELNEAKVKSAEKFISMRHDGFKSVDHVCSILYSKIGKSEA